MEEKITVEFFDEMMDTVIFKLPNADAQTSFLKKLGTDRNLYRKFEEDALAACAACQRQGYKAGFRTAVALFSGKTDIDVTDITN